MDDERWLGERVAEAMILQRKEGLSRQIAWGFLRTQAGLLPRGEGPPDQPLNRKCSTSPSWTS